MKPAPSAAAGRRPYQGSVPANVWKRLTEMQLCLRGEIPDSDTGRLRCEMALNHFAWLPDGARLMDDWLNVEAPWMLRAERERMKAEAHADMRTYDAAVAGRIAGLLWAFRCEHVIKTMIAIDTPPAQEVKKRRNELNASNQRVVRARKQALPKPLPANKLRSIDLQKRRLTAILDVLSAKGAMSIADLCAVLRRAKNGPFNMVKKPEDLPRVVRRVIKQDCTLRTEPRPVEGRPDLRSSMYVSLKTPAAEKEPALKNKQTAPPPIAPVGMTEAEYRARLERKLAQFTPETTTDLIAWYRSPAERALLANSGLSLEVMRARVMARHNELIAQRKATAGV